MSEDYRILDVEWLRDIWRPDCFFKNAKKVTFHEMSIPNHYLWLYHDKTLLYMSKYDGSGGIEEGRVVEDCIAEIIKKCIDQRPFKMFNRNILIYIYLSTS